MIPMTSDEVIEEMRNVDILLARAKSLSSELRTAKGLKRVADLLAELNSVTERLRELREGKGEK